MIVGVPKETFPNERRVALTPLVLPTLQKKGVSVVLETGAGASAGYPDGEYSDKGAEIAPSRADVFGKAEVILQVRAAGANPDGAAADAALLGAGKTVIAFCDPLSEPQAAQAFAGSGAALLSMELMPRITRAQSMDALSSQATVAGYKAVLRAATLAPRLFPMLTTAAGTLRPASVVVIGAGVAGLQAIATARRLGARVEAYDIRAAAREQVESLGAKMIDTGVNAEAEGGYARELTDEEKAQQADVLAQHIAKADVVISTAAVPGRPAPKIITAAMVEGMAPGSVVVDMAAESGGNCELTRPGESVAHGTVTVDGPLDLASSAPIHASEMYARNLMNLLELVVEGEGETLNINREDEVVDGCLLTHGGELVHAQVRKQLEG